MANDDINQFTAAVEDAVTYPILTRGVDGYGGGRNGDSSGSPGGGSLTRTAQGAIRDLLGWRYRSSDPKGFVTALTKAVELKEVEGHTEWTWKARPLTVQADLGEITGAQASIYSRAKVALEHSLPLLDNLEPLRPDADKEKTQSIRAMVRSGLTELVGELGVGSGPRLQRVDDYFTDLLGPNPNAQFARPEGVRGQLGELAKRFGLVRGRVLTVVEELNFTNFLIVVDYTNSLFQTWQNQKAFLSRNGSSDKFLGTQLVRLAQTLAVIVESVHEAYDAMDSVFFGPEERQVAVLDFVGQQPITVAELLSWVEQFAAVEAPQMIEDCGKDGVISVSATLSRLSVLLELASQESNQP